MTKIPAVLKAEAANPKPVAFCTNRSRRCFGHWILEFAAHALNTVEIYANPAEYPAIHGGDECGAGL